MSQGEALERLNAFVGEWTVEAMNRTGRSSFEWALDGQYLLQRTTVPGPVPDSWSIYAPTDEPGSYRQHYFDSRGIARLYAMTVTEQGHWSLERHEPDFSPLPFHQRFTATVEEDTITGRWESSEIGEAWELDFVLTYGRLGSSPKRLGADRRGITL
jgi:hypothetical protein